MKTIKYYFGQIILKLKALRKYIYSSFILTFIFFVLRFFNVYSYSWLVLCLPIGIIVVYFSVVFCIWLFSLMLSYLLD